VVLVQGESESAQGAREGARFGRRAGAPPIASRRLLSHESDTGGRGVTLKLCAVAMREEEQPHDEGVVGFATRD
jgi:hypothetical protein